MNIYDLESAQNEVSNLIKTCHLNNETNIRYIDLVSEVGELGKEILLASNYGTQKEKYTDNFSLEIGDVFFSLLCICESQRINLNESFSQVLDKYKARYKSKEDIGSME